MIKRFTFWGTFTVLPPGDRPYYCSHHTDEENRSIERINGLPKITELVLSLAKQTLELRQFGSRAHSLSIYYIASLAAD